MLLRHLAALLLLLALATGLATWRNGLWPFDLRYSAVVALGGLAVLALGWGPVWLALGAASAGLSRIRLRLALWPPAIGAMIALHALFGAALGFAPIRAIAPLDLGLLYMIPTALALLTGSALREAIWPAASPQRPFKLKEASRWRIP